MADLAPSAGMTKVGSIALVLVIALVAVYLVNNFSFFTNITKRRTATAA